MFDNIEIFRDDGRAMACLVFTEEIGDMDTVPIYNFTAENVVFRNIKYNAAMKSKFSAANETNTMNVTIAEGLYYFFTFLFIFHKLKGIILLKWKNKLINL